MYSVDYNNFHNMSQISSNTKNNNIILRNHSRNKRYKLAIKKAIKKYLLSLNSDKLQSSDLSNNLKNSLDNLSLVYKRIDKAVKRKVLHKNNAARKKRRLARMLK
uniref:Ribosomal protein S20 n=1 Tax=Osmundea sinicola TaxID=290685 RepID=A0A7L4WP84_9FLOR|nr:ribosomal protein S20 [Osmundea sinicola]QFR99887.1 ribosomal protein S20 [Osmundea sinicola]